MASKSPYGNMSLYSQFIYKTRYSRWLWEDNRREEWPETVSRYIDYIFQRCGLDDPELKSSAWDAIYNMEVMPSMRALMTAGPALDVSNVAGFNCAYMTVDSPRAFDELLYILMNGTGVGFSVEKRYTSQLPVVPTHFTRSERRVTVEDSKIGWASAIRTLVEGLYAGRVSRLATHMVRAEGEPLKTFGGRASGPGPLLQVAEFITKIFLDARGRQLRPIECHDICCMIAACVVVGGVRRSALISLSDLDDEEMRYAKSGAWWEKNSQRALANNSAVYEGPLTRERFEQEWDALVASRSGERGIFNRTAAQAQAKRAGRSDKVEYGVNPCGEILLRPNEFCNLTEVVARAIDDLMSLRRKVRMASILGTLQSCLTDFAYLRSIWKENCEEERLLGVSLTGIFDCPLLHNSNVLGDLRAITHEVNYELANRLGINPSASITCVKPSGTVSQLVDSASGIHPRYAKFYLRRVRNDSKDPVTTFLEESGFPTEIDFYNPKAKVFTFPQRAPEGATIRADLDPINHLEIWLLFREHWCDHNPSVTIQVKEDEWNKIGDWVYDHFDSITGTSFLPYSAEDSSYVQLPYEEIDEDVYNELSKKLPKNVLWSDLSFYENNGENITAGRELACQGGSCEL